MSTTWLDLGLRAMQHGHQLKHNRLVKRPAGQDAFTCTHAGCTARAHTREGTRDVLWTYGVGQACPVTPKHPQAREERVG